jgi:DNA polymerase-4
MSLTDARRLAKDLEIVAPNPAAYQKVNNALEVVIKRYAPAWQNDGWGNLYLDITGTGKLFGAPADCVCRIQNEIVDSLSLKAAAATATNKLVSKVASRAIRPLGLIDVRPGEEAAFLAHQDITLLPGLGASLMKTIRVTGFREAGELAALSDSEASALFGKKGILLRDAALGIDDSPVTRNEGRRIERRVDFAEDVLDDDIICGAIASISGHGGLEMRNEKLGVKAIRLAVVYNDGVQAHGFQKLKHILVTDGEIKQAVYALYKKTTVRRIRLRSICLALEDLSPLEYQVDLFEPETELKSRRLQEAVDRIRNRYHSAAVIRAIVLAAGNGRKLGIRN